MATTIARSRKSKHNSLCLISRLILGIVWALFFQACTTPPDNNYSDYRELSEEGWQYGKSLIFKPEFRDSVARGLLVAAVTHSAEFPYTELWLEVTIDTLPGVAPSSASVPAADTLKMQLADGYGRWIGRGIGPQLQVTDTLPREVTLLRGTPLKVRHIMQTDTLMGIEQVGVFFIADTHGSHKK